MGNHQASMFKGTLDIIVVQGPDGIWKSSGWFLRQRRRYRSPLSMSDCVPVLVAINGNLVDNFEIPLSHFKKDSVGVPTYSPCPADLERISGYLEKGRNPIEFIIKHKPEASLVFVDVDGTLTRSNLEGLHPRCFKRFGMHEGAVILFSYLKGEGCEIVYLTARPISMATRTRQTILKYVDKKNGNAKLPPGPVLSSCEDLEKTVAKLRWILYNKFKTVYLKQIRDLVDKISFHQGFGNTKHDNRSYREAGIFFHNIHQIQKDGSITTYDEHGNKTVWYKNYPMRQTVIDDAVRSSYSDSEPLLPHRR